MTIGPFESHTRKGVRNGKNLANGKETIRRTIVVAKRGPEWSVPIDVRWYMGRSNHASVVYCTVWLGQNSGTGKAGGYGYHKESAAFGDALGSAGVTLTRAGREANHEIHGVGDSAIRSALEAIMRELGWKNSEFAIF